MTEKLENTVDSGDHVAVLRALQKRIAKQIDETASSRDVASLSKQLREITEALKAIDEDGKEKEVSEKVTELDLVRKGKSA